MSDRDKRKATFFSTLESEDIEERTMNSDFYLSDISGMSRITMTEREMALLIRKFLNEESHELRRILSEIMCKSIGNGLDYDVEPIVGYIEGRVSELVSESSVFSEEELGPLIDTISFGGSLQDKIQIYELLRRVPRRLKVNLGDSLHDLKCKVEKGIL